MRWLVDTSAWARRGQQEVTEQLREIVTSGDQLALSPPVLLELLRAPQGDEVAVERRSLTEAMEMPVMSPQTFELAAGAMEKLACHAPEAHRLPIADLLTAALAHQHDCGVVHCDGDYQSIAAHSGLSFRERRLAFQARRTVG